MNAYAHARSYAETAVLTATPEQLVVMAYDWAIRALRQSAEAMRRGDRERSRNRMRTGELLIDELNNALDMSYGEIPSRLRSIYLYCKRLLIQANVNTDVESIEVVVSLLAKLRESWYQIATQTESKTA